MTLPPYMNTNRAASFDDSLQDLESAVVSTLAHKFMPLVNLGMFELPQEYCPPVDDINIGMANKKRPLTPDEAANVVDSALGDYQLVTPPPTPQRRPAKKARISRQPSSSKPVRSSCTLPTAEDPIDDSFCMKLYSNRDEGKINPAHIVVRRQVLEVRRTLSGRVLFQCACCKHLPRAERAKLSTLAPQSVDNLYRAMVRFMMNHVRACEHVPQEIKDLSPKASRVVTERGTKMYWVKSAKRMGLRDGEDGKSIVFCGSVTNC